MSTIQKVLITIGTILLIAAISLFYFNHKEAEQIGGKQKMSEQEKAEQYAEKMKPKIEEKIKKDDIHHFVKTITFDKNVTIDPMGSIVVTGYINNESKKFKFDATLIYGSNKVDSMGYSKELADRFKDWSEYSKEVKEKYIKTAYPDKEEREQYLKDIGEKE
ncbi:DUF1433 domain-containing protein [Bacillus haynesii]|uniref:DUF1433 domain-containing protein n=1 Tax=Bacillus haynesii TaxID=1925021 RepID=UPI002282C08E|nr:DUF1433 domain-containing protein [Bacillus haynesii]MCY9371872.1 DUF1433 domain-containing protein [Bacillus haynesii]